MQRFKLKIVLLAIVALVASGCGRHWVGIDSGDAGDRTREIPASIRTVDMSVPRATLLGALQQELLIDRARIVDVFQSKADGGVPLYRIFEVHPRSIFGVLGLKNADVIVSANGKTLANKDVFKAYVRLLREEKDAQVEIVRGAEPILFKYTFVD